MSGTFNAFRIYGVNRWGDLFTAPAERRHSLTLALQSSRPSANDSDALRAALALVVDRCADYASSSWPWAPIGEYVGNMFGRQAIADGMGFCEGSLLVWIQRVL